MRPSVFRLVDRENCGLDEKRGPVPATHLSSTHSTVPDDNR